MFKFGVVGTGNIAHQFAKAIAQIKTAKISAVCDLLLDKATDFAHEFDVDRVYKDFDEMLETAGLDGVYISTTAGAHFALVMSSLAHRTPVLCEKAMFLTGEDAETAFSKAREMNTFAMEGQWNRFLPTLRKAKCWIDEGRIGRVTSSHMEIGFVAPTDPQNRYFNRQLGGGAMYDLTVYGHGLTTLMYDGWYSDSAVFATWGKTEVDETDHVVLTYPHAIATFTTSFIGSIDDRLAVYGTEGSLIIEQPHNNPKLAFYDKDKRLVERYKDEGNRHGLTYEIEEMMNCVAKHEIESSVVPHQLTIKTAQIYDKIQATRPVVQPLSDR